MITNLRMEHFKALISSLISISTKCDGVREDYVEILKRYVEVDIFGACGDKECGRTEDHNTRECDQMLERDYRWIY